MLLCLFLCRALIIVWHISVADTLAHLPCSCLFCPCHQDLNRIAFLIDHAKTFVVYVTTTLDLVASTTLAEAWKVPADRHEGRLTPSKVGWSKDGTCLC